eukprot:6213027-Pleurochrysis_carterae.AAC.1
MPCTQAAEPHASIMQAFNAFAPCMQRTGCHCLVHALMHDANTHTSATRALDVLRVVRTLPTHSYM